MKIKELSKKSLDLIYEYWISKGDNDDICNAFYGICGATTVVDYSVYTEKEWDSLFRLKYKLGHLILKKIKAADN